MAYFRPVMSLGQNPRMGQRCYLTGCSLLPRTPTLGPGRITLAVVPGHFKTLNQLLSDKWPYTSDL